MSPQPTTIATFAGLASGINTTAIISNIQAFAEQPITQLTTTSTTENSELTALQSFNTMLAAVQTAGEALASPSTFAANTATSSNTSVATITASAGALAGTNTLTVNTLAQAQQIVSKQYGSNNLGLGETGTFTLNGHAIDVTATDTLTSIASKINSANAGVTASVADVGANTYQLSLSSNQSGVAYSISDTDSTGTVLQDLGFLNGTADSIRQTVGSNAAATITTSSSSTPLGTLFGYAAGTAPSGTVTIGNGGSGAGDSGSISINLNTDSLSAVAGKINAAGINGISAQVVSLPDANGNVGGGGQQLVISNTNNGTSTAPTFTDGSNILGTLGILQTTTTGANQPVAAQDANFSYNNLTYTRATNTIGDLIPGATVTLLSQTPTTGSSPTPATTTLTIAQNTSSIVTAVQNFASAYNNVIDYIGSQNSFTPPTGDNEGTQIATAPLFGSPILTAAQEQLSNALAVNAGTTTLGSIGISTDPTTGELDVNTDMLTSALQTNASGVQSLFGVIGHSNNSNVQYVSSGANTQPSTGAGYAVNITAAATESTADATTAQTAPSTQAEVLTFSGVNFSSPVAITLTPNNTLQQTVNQINGDSELNSILSASIDQNGNLLINSNAYGAQSAFSVISNLAAASDNSGIGLAPTITQGTDVAGTINGEAATGAGQTLSGNAGNKTTDGLELTVTATTPGAYGSVSVTQGIGTQLNTLLNSLLNPTTGEIEGSETALNTQISNNEQQITNIQNQVADQTSYLQTMYATMESQISALQSQGQAFTAVANGIAGSASSSSSSSSSSSTKSA